MYGSYVKLDALPRVSIVVVVVVLLSYSWIRHCFQQLIQQTTTMRFLEIFKVSQKIMIFPEIIQNLGLWWTWEWFFKTFI